MEERLQMPSSTPNLQELVSDTISSTSDRSSLASVDSYSADTDQDVESYEDEIKQVKKRKERIGRTKRIQIDNLLVADHYKNQVSGDEGWPTQAEGKSDGNQQRFMENQSKIITFSIVRELFVRPNKHCSPASRYIKMTKNPQQPFLVVDTDIDYTPKRLVTPDDPEWVREPMLFKFPRPPKFMDYKPDDMLVLGKKFEKKKEDDEYPALESSASKYDSHRPVSSIAPPMFPLKLPKPYQLNKLEMTFQLKETDTVILLDLVSKSSGVNDTEGKLTKIANMLNEVVSKRIRKKMDNNCQTSMDTKKRTKETQLSSNPTANKYAYSSNYEYFDTMEKHNKRDEVVPVGRGKHKVGKVDSVKYQEDRSEVGSIVEANLVIKDKLKWYRMAMTMERVLLSNNAMKRQLVFHDHLQTDPYATNVQFKYDLTFLCTLQTNETKGMAVTCMSWHWHENNILAVGYGKYNFVDKCKGVVCIWNNKNLAHPERQFQFQHPVTRVRFCQTFPGIVAIAFYSGWVILVNIVKQEKVKVVAKNMPFDKTSVVPVWDIVWLKGPVYRFENVVECRGDGCVYHYVRRHLYEKKLMMKIYKIKRNLKGITREKKCQSYVIPVNRNPAILCIAIQPENNGVYLIGSDEGEVYKCWLRDANQHLDVFLAHRGPVYEIQYHPACSKIFMTCGADWQIRVWADGILVPLLTMTSGTTAVLSAKWSPLNPSIIIAITNINIHVWDISRRINNPQSTYENPNGNFYTSLEFSRCGQNVCVGDKDGNLLIYTLSNMPFPPANPDMILALILIKALTSKRDLLADLIKLGAPFNVSRIYKTYLNLT